MFDVSKSDLVAVRMPLGRAWLEVVEHVWDRGAAIMPLDQRAPDALVGRLIERARATVVFDGETARRIDGEPVADDVALVIATSGTAAEPKLVEHTHAGLGAALRAGAARLAATETDAWLLCLPVAHMGGMLVLARAAKLGAPLVVHERFDVETVATAEAAFTSLVPTMIHRLVADARPPTAIRAALVGGAALGEGLARAAASLGWTCVQTYGLTETCGGIVYDGVPLDGAELSLDDDGRIRVRGAMAMRGYRGEPPRDPSAWLDTRDAGVFVDGHLVVLGRVDDVVNTGGVKVWPDAVEDALRAHPSVRDACVVGEPDAEWGEIVVVAVVTNGDQPALDELRGWVAERLGRAAAPRRIVPVDAVPRTAGGKVRRAQVRAMLGIGRPSYAE